MKYNDYNEYLKEQIVRAESKWARKPQYNDIFKDNLKNTWTKVKDLLGDPKQICCMGVRDGTEVFEFRKYYQQATVYGVDITENIKTIKDNTNIYLYDFNNLPEDWTNKFDLIFSNSIDHAYDIQKTVNEWYRVTKKGGCLFLELSTAPATNIEHSFNLDMVEDLFANRIHKIWQEQDKIVVVVAV